MSRRKIRSIEVVEIATGKVVSRINVEGKAEATIDRVEYGMRINMDRERFFTRQSSRAATPPAKDTKP